MQHLADNFAKLSDCNSKTLRPTSPDGIATDSETSPGIMPNARNLRGYITYTILAYNYNQLYHLSGHPLHF